MSTQSFTTTVAPDVTVVATTRVDLSVLGRGALLLAVDDPSSDFHGVALCVTDTGEFAVTGHDALHLANALLTLAPRWWLLGYVEELDGK